MIHSDQKRSQAFASKACLLREGGDNMAENPEIHRVLEISTRVSNDGVRPDGGISALHLRHDVVNGAIEHG
jgi:hypothetical protein